MSDRSESEVEHSGSERYEIGNDIARRARTETPRLDVLRDELPELSEKELRLLDDNIEKAIRDTVARTLRDREDRKAVTDGGVDQSEAGADHWQVVEITGVGLGEMWFDEVADELTQREAERRASNRERYVAVPMPYDPDHEVPIGHVVDSYDRQVVENV